MNKLTLWLIVAIVGISVLVSAGPTLIGLMEAAVPLVLVVGAVAIGIGIVWRCTDRY